jgi:hypothetical protein
MIGRHRASARLCRAEALVARRPPAAPAIRNRNLRRSPMIPLVSPPVEASRNHSHYRSPMIPPVSPPVEASRNHSHYRSPMIPPVSRRVEASRNHNHYRSPMIPPVSPPVGRWPSLPRRRKTRNGKPPSQRAPLPLRGLRAASLLALLGPG